MPFDGAGNYTPSPAPNFPAISGDPISSTYYNNVINDIATALSNCLTRDNQGKPSAAQNWNGQNLTNVNILSVASLAVSGTSAFTGDITVPDEAFGVGWDGSLEVPTKNAVYDQVQVINALIASSVAGLLEMKGALDCSANPNYPAADKGDSYYVTVAGKVGGAAGLAVDIGDLIVASANNAGGTQAAVGTSWFILEHNLQGALLAANNLSDLANAATARTNLGVGIGANVQAWSALLDSYNAAVWTAGVQVPTLTAANTVALRTVGSAATNILDKTAGDALYAPLALNVQTVASAATLTPTFSNDQVQLTALAAACQLLNPTGTAQNGWGIVVRIKDNGTARALTYDTQYRAIGVTLPTTTVLGKTLYLGMIYNSADTKWDVVSVAQQA